jgi:hypothetical protein
LKPEYYEPDGGGSHRRNVEEFLDAYTRTRPLCVSLEALRAVAPEAVARAERYSEAEAEATDRAQWLRTEREHVGAGDAERDAAAFCRLHDAAWRNAYWEAAAPIRGLQRGLRALLADD